jgi:hypothetical protein
LTILAEQLVELRIGPARSLRLVTPQFRVLSLQTITLSKQARSGGPQAAYLRVLIGSTICSNEHEITRVGIDGIPILPPCDIQFHGGRIGPPSSQ